MSHIRFGSGGKTGIYYIGIRTEGLYSLVPSAPVSLGFGGDGCRGPLNPKLY